MIVVERFLANGLVAGAVALLAYARGIALLPVMFAQAVGSGVFPAAAERFKALERDSLVRLAVNGMRLSVLAGLVSTAYVVICRRELVQIAFERRAFTAADAATTATLVGILAVALTGASLTASGARTLFALGRRREVLVVSAAALALYVVAAVVLREAYGLNGLAAAFPIASTAAESSSRRCSSAGSGSAWRAWRASGWRRLSCWPPLSPSARWPSGFRSAGPTRALRPRSERRLQSGSEVSLSSPSPSGSPAGSSTRSLERALTSAGGRG